MSQWEGGFIKRKNKDISDYFGKEKVITTTLLLRKGFAPAHVPWNLIQVPSDLQMYGSHPAFSSGDPLGCAWWCTLSSCPSASPDGTLHGL